MQLITKNELAQMEVLLADLLPSEGTDTSWSNSIQKARLAYERFQILKLHAQLMAIYETQSALRKAEERLQQFTTQISQ